MIDVLHCNDYEARSITGKTDLRWVIEELLGLGVALPIVSRGDQGLLCAYEGCYHSVPAFRVTAVDPTGAGDAFTAGFIKRLVELEGSTIEDKLGGASSNLFEALLFGAAAGASCATALGCTPAVNEKDVSELFESQSRDVLSAISSETL